MRGSRFLDELVASPCMLLGLASHAPPSCTRRLLLTQGRSRPATADAGVYFGLSLVASTMNLTGTMALYYAFLRVSKKLHVQTLSGVLASPMSFFDTTPTGCVSRLSESQPLVSAMSLSSRDRSLVEQEGAQPFLKGAAGDARNPLSPQSCTDPTTVAAIRSCP